MAKVLSSISGNLISAASAGYAPTNSADVSAIASGYQVVSSTATQLYAGTAYVTSVNGDALSAARAGNAANASLANSAYYDGTGRLISSLPDSAAVSSIASSYAESAASGKLDSTAFSAVSGDFLTAETVSSITTAQYGPQPTDVGVTAINGFGLVAKSADTAYSAIWASIAGTDVNLRALTSLADSAAVSSIASSYAESAVSGVVDTVSSNSATWGAGVSLPITGTSGDDSASYDAYHVEFTRYDTAGEPDIRTAELSPDHFYIDYTLDGNDHTSMSLTESMLTFTNPDGDHWVDAYSIDTWNSAVDTVANNSASWGGGATGDYVEKSAIDVTIGSNNSANNRAFAQGADNTAGLGSFAQGTDNSARLNSLVQGNRNSAEKNSFAQGTGNSASYTSLAQGVDNTASVNSFAQGFVNSAINTAAVFGTYNLRGDGSTSTGNSAAFAIGDGTGTAARHDLMLVTKDGEITMYSSTADTVGTGIMSSLRAISAAATGGGGVDSATVSSIASSYAESAVSSKQDSSAMSAYALSSNVSGVIDTVSANSASWTTDLTDYATTGYVDSSVSSKLDSSASSSFYTTANESGYVGSAYVDSAVSGKMDSSAIDYTRTGGGTQIYASGTGSSTNQFSAKNDSAGAAIIAGENARLRLWDTAATANLYASSIGGWNAASNLVSSQSANWGGSALALSAGPGVKLEMSGNTLVASTDETVLWSGSGNAFTTTEPLTNFSEIKFHIKSHASANVGESVVPMVDNNRTAIKLSWADDWNKGSDWLGGLRWWSNLNNTGMTSFVVSNAYYIGLRSGATFGGGSYGTNIYVLDVIGINRTAGV